MTRAQRGCTSQPLAKQRAYRVLHVLLASPMWAAAPQQRIECALVRKRREGESVCVRVCACVCVCVCACVCVRASLSVSHSPTRTDPHTPTDSRSVSFCSHPVSALKRPNGDLLQTNQSQSSPFQRASPTTTWRWRCCYRLKRLWPTPRMRTAVPSQLTCHPTSTLVRFKAGSVQRCLPSIKCPSLFSSCSRPSPLPLPSTHHRRHSHHHHKAHIFFHSPCLLWCFRSAIGAIHCDVQCSRFKRQHRHPCAHR